MVDKKTTKSNAIEGNAKDRMVGGWGCLYLLGVYRYWMETIIELS